MSPCDREPVANTYLQQYQALLDQSTPFVLYRWIGSGIALFVFFLRILLAEGWYIGKHLFASHLQFEFVSNMLNRSRVRSRHLPPEPLPRVPPAQVRPLQR